MMIRRIIEPILLGSIANILINYIFDPSNPDFIWKEFLVAWCLAVPLTELNRYIDRVLERKLNWTENPVKRFFSHLFYLVLALLLSVDILGGIYTWLAYNSFYSWSELLLINMVTLTVAILLTTLRWTTDFHKRWKTAEHNFHDSSQKLNSLSSEINKASTLIEIQRGNTKHKVEPKNIQLAKSEFGIVRVHLKNDQNGLFQGSLNKLDSLLPEYLFFNAARNIIIHRDTIVSISSSSYGKILLKIKENILSDDTIIVSRPKAASFRKWHNSNSISN